MNRQLGLLQSKRYTLLSMVPSLIVSRDPWDPTEEVCVLQASEDCSSLLEFTYSILVWTNQSHFRIKTRDRVSTVCLPTASSSPTLNPWARLSLATETPPYPEGPLPCSLSAELRMLLCHSLQGLSLRAQALEDAHLGVALAIRPTTRLGRHLPAGSVGTAPGAGSPRTAPAARAAAPSSSLSLACPSLRASGRRSAPYFYAAGHNPGAPPREFPKAGLHLGPGLHRGVGETPPSSRTGILRVPAVCCNGRHGKQNYLGHCCWESSQQDL